ncbi:hypothetical protein AGRO_2304 [Agrobacterium sp. ATCC 31749]|nr:hypothetical protein AGRO_2304 [Agrobacterium sp. ATCC 31749]
MWNGEPHTVARMKMQAFMRKNRKNGPRFSEPVCFRRFRA